jgi:hypothetical protein
MTLAPTNTHRTGSRENAWPYRRTTVTGAEYRLGRDDVGKWTITRNGSLLMTIPTQAEAIFATDYCVLNDSQLASYIIADDLDSLMDFVAQARGAAKRTATAHPDGAAAPAGTSGGYETRAARARRRAADPGPDPVEGVTETLDLRNARILESAAARIVDDIRQGKTPSPLYVVTVYRAIEAIAPLAVERAP